MILLDKNEPEERSIEMITLAYYLSRCKMQSPDGTLPPRKLDAKTWKDASDRFFGSVSGDRSTKRFYGSLMNAKKAFDDEKQWNSGRHLEIREAWERETDEELEAFVLNLIAENSVEGEKSFVQGIKRTEGGVRYYVSKKYERDVELRDTALKLHGYECMACGFDFEQTYGELGKGFAEVHHMTPLHNGEIRETDPATDLSVLCSNCHRMVHRKRDAVLELKELRSILAAQKAT